MRLIDETLMEIGSREATPRATTNQVALMQRIQQTTGIGQFGVGFAATSVAHGELLRAFLEGVADGRLAPDSSARIYGSPADGTAPLELLSGLNETQRSRLSYCVGYAASESVARALHGPWLTQLLGRAPTELTGNQVLSAIARATAVQLRALRGLGLREYGVVVLDAFNAELDRVVHSLRIMELGEDDIVCLEDTVGVATPTKVMDRLRALRGALPQARFCVRFRDDFGLATANTLAAFEAHAASAVVSMNGVGDRTGNAATQSVVMALHTLYGVAFAEQNLAGLNDLAREVEQHCGIVQSPQAPVTGRLSHMAQFVGHSAAVTELKSHGLAPYPAKSVGARSETLHATASVARVRDMLARRSVQLRTLGLTIDDALASRAVAWADRERVERWHRQAASVRAAMEAYEAEVRRSYVTLDDIVNAALVTQGRFDE